MPLQRKRRRAFEDSKIQPLSVQNMLQTIFEHINTPLRHLCLDQSGGVTDTVIPRAIPPAWLIKTTFTNTYIATCLYRNNVNVPNTPAVHNLPNKLSTVFIRTIFSVISSSMKAVQSNICGLH